MLGLREDAVTMKVVGKRSMVDHGGGSLRSLGTGAVSQATENSIDRDLKLARHRDFFLLARRWNSVCR